MELFELLKTREGLSLSDQKMNFNSTEIRLLAEVYAAKKEGKKFISTQLATLLGITRSAVSQIVNRLEARGAVRRVADEVDRKIAYIEMTEEILELYEEDLKVCKNFVCKVVDRFGEEKFEEMYRLFNEFVGVLEEEKNGKNAEK